MVEAIPRADLLGEIKKVAEELGKVPTVREIDREGEFSTATYYREFESWNSALETAGFDPNHHYDVSRDELLDAIRDLASDLGRPPTRTEMVTYGRFSGTPFYREFDGWNDALNSAGFDLHQHDAERGELLEEIRWLAIDDRPPPRERLEDEGKFSPQAYVTEFGSWNNALKEAGYEPRRYSPGRRKEYEYGDGWSKEKRESVRERDDYECQHCGMSNGDHEDQFGEALHVHHLIPANEFEEPDRRNDTCNLVALCRLHHRTWEAADDVCPLDQSLPEDCDPEAVDQYTR